MVMYASEVERKKKKNTWDKKTNYNIYVTETLKVFGWPNHHFGQTSSVDWPSVLSPVNIQQKMFHSMSMQ